MSAAELITSGELSGRLWLYSNYDCNLSCDYCLTESAPRAPRRALDPDRMVGLAREAAELGFTGVGITGGEPFLLQEMVPTLARIADVLPVLVLSNGTLFNQRLLDSMRELAARPVSVQISLDDADAGTNDAHRGEGSHAKAVEGIRALVALGVEVRVATTGGSDDALVPLRGLNRQLGISDDDHVVRPIVRRGRASDQGVAIDEHALPPELTVTTDGAYWSPFAPTVRGGRPDTDLLITRTTAPLSRAADALCALIQARPAGTAATLDIL